MKKAIIIISIMWALPAVSQQSGKPRICVIPEAAVLNGNKTVSAAGALNVALFTNSWAFGAGAGIDYYKVRSVPVFFLARKELSKKIPVFLYTNIGYTIPAPLQNQYLRQAGTWGISGSSFRSGLYGEGGIGYALPARNRKGLEFLLGYSGKTMTETYTEIIYRDFPPYVGEESPHSYHYTFNRLVIKIGVRLW